MDDNEIFRQTENIKIKKKKRRKKLNWRCDAYRYLYIKILNEIRHYTLECMNDVKYFFRR